MLDVRLRHSIDARMAANLVWIDLEMTGLDAEKDAIIEIASVVTDAELRVLAEGPDLAIQAPEVALAGMDDWNAEHHEASGLLARVRREGVGLREAEARTLSFIERFASAGCSPLCGNSVWQDRRFLAKHMPALDGYLHYRNIDVSSVKELALRWRPDVAEQVRKQSAHLALADIHESIEELRLYRRQFFRLN